MDTVVVDLDVLTVAFWDKDDDRKEDAEKFLERIEKGEFELFTPLLLFQQIHSWKHSDLSTDIASFLFRNSSDLVDVRELEASIEKYTGNLVSTVLEKAIEEISNTKESDINLVLYASSLDADYLVTYDKSHLLGNEEEIKNFLNSQDLPAIEIVKPEDLG